jgi:DNA-directed RNA polymerase subunit RPC12/RpoP
MKNYRCPRCGRPWTTRVDLKEIWCNCGGRFIRKPVAMVLVDDDEVEG